MITAHTHTAGYCFLCASFLKELESQLRFSVKINNLVSSLNWPGLAWPKKDKLRKGKV